MLIRKLLIFIILLLSHFFIFSAPQASLVHNTQQEIDACIGKVQLKLVYTWGEDEDNDEHKFFKYPHSIIIDKNDLVYISDISNFCVKVFKRAGNYVHTIGRKGRGPGDLVGPGSISIAPDGLLWVCEQGGRRIQAFNTSGKSQTIIKHKELPSWISITGKNEIAVHSHYRTFMNRTLITIYSTRGKRLREIGKYHDPSKALFGSEHLVFTKDRLDNFLVANTWLPVIRKYSPHGQLTRVFTFDTPFFIPVKVSLNAEGNEITRSGDEESGYSKIRKIKNGYALDFSKNNKKWEKIYLCNGLHTGPDNNLYLVTRNRNITEKEKQATTVTLIGPSYDIYRSSVDYDIAESTAMFSLYVFNPQGKIIAATKLTTFCDRIYVSGNRLFVVDGTLNQRILEYEIKIIP